MTHWIVYPRWRIPQPANVRQGKSDGKQGKAVGISDTPRLSQYCGEHSLSSDSSMHEMIQFYSVSIGLDLHEEATTRMGRAICFLCVMVTAYGEQI